jgi:hypothetical protein
MAYVPRWERRDEACKRVMEAGLPKREVQRDICRAMAVEDITVRPSLDLIKKTIQDHQIHHRYARQIAKFAHALFNGLNRYPKPWEALKPFSVPRKLKPHDLDWPKSCFKTPFSIAIRPDIAPMLWDVSIELFSRDVTRCLIATSSAARNKPKEQSGRRPAAGERSTRGSPKRNKRVCVERNISRPYSQSRQRARIRSSLLKRQIRQELHSGTGHDLEGGRPAQRCQRAFAPWLKMQAKCCDAVTLAGAPSLGSCTGGRICALEPWAKRQTHFATGWRSKWLNGLHCA